MRGVPVGLSPCRGRWESKSTDPDPKRLESAGRPTTRTSIAVVAIVAAASFASGFWTSQLLDGDRVRNQAEERFKELISVGTDLGIVTIDEDKLNEAIIAGSEGPWEDKEAAERGQGGKK